ncbi:hypothetical protein F4553_001935 [Allocatelliglobosispora scoriae]|uniref:Uncharacterized protein n=1 Tax=Allocatelliglobosispora scoriae TaxID=643052 RepID=A0A841BMR5_9ACTN|nr:hypothetical protein [Allocatelliglobosispora scoriae]MBB5868556.1 hypothetical protein [Allocatelliglobosispora scoriae]
MSEGYVPPIRLGPDVARAWSLGPTGDAIWDEFPEVRPAMKQLICEGIEYSINANKALAPVEPYAFLVHCLGPYLDSHTGGPSYWGALARMLWRCLRYEGPANESERYNMQVYVLDRFDPGVLRENLRKVDPAVADYVDYIFPEWWTAE